jgi:nucleoside kinase
MGDLCIIGSPALDHIITVPKFAEPETRVSVTSFSREYGGFAANIAVIASKLGLQVGIAGSIGNDLYGKLYLRYLNEQGIDTFKLKMVGKPTAKCFLIVNEQQRKEITYFYHGAEDVKPELDKAWLSKYKMIHLCSKDATTNLIFARAFKGKVSFDLRTCISDITKQELLELLKLTDILFVRENEVDQLFNILKVRTIGEVKKKGPRIIVITRGKRGVALYLGRQKIYLAPPLLSPKKAYISGAGDGFRAGFLVSQIRKKDIHLSAKIGAIVSYFVLQEPGAQTSIPSWDRVMETYDDLRAKKII